MFNNWAMNWPQSQNCMKEQLETILEREKQTTFSFCESLEISVFTTTRAVNELVCRFHK